MVFILLLLFIAAVEAIPYKIAFVKQVVYQDLYCCSSNASLSDRVLSSFWRTGPVGLFTAYNADFYIIDLEPDPECNLWQEKARHPGGPDFNFYMSLLKEPQPGYAYAQGAFARKADSIDWSIYDIVVCMDTPIPARITRKHKKTLWAYYIGEPGRQGSYHTSFQKPVEGYDCFLTQNFVAQHPAYAPHVIEFPYNLQYFPCYEELFNRSIDDASRSGILLQLHTALGFSKQQKKRLAKISPLLARKGKSADMPLDQMLDVMCRAKYFLFFARGGAGQRDIFRGNVIIDPIAGGCLVIAHPASLMNQDLLSPLTSVYSFDQLVERVEFFEKNPTIFARELALQREKCNYLCFTRPMEQLFEKCAQKNHVMKNKTLQ